MAFLGWKWFLDVLRLMASHGYLCHDQCTRVTSGTVHPIPCESGMEVWVVWVGLVGSRQMTQIARAPGRQLIQKKTPSKRQQKGRLTQVLSANFISSPLFWGLRTLRSSSFGGWKVKKISRSTSVSTCRFRTWPQWLLGCWGPLFDSLSYHFLEQEDPFIIWG